MSETKYPRLASQLKRAIRDGRYGREAIPGNIKLAEAFGVNHLTMRKAIGELVEQGWLKPRGRRGTFLTRKALRAMPTCHQAGLVMGDLMGLEHPHFRKLVAGVRSVLDEQPNFNTSIITLPSSPQSTVNTDHLERMIGHDLLHAVVLLGVKLDGQQLDRLSATGVPAVSIGFGNPGIPAVHHDRHHMSRMVVEHVLSRGCRHVGLIGGYSNTTTEMNHDIPNKLRKRGVEVAPSSVFAAEDNLPSPETGYRAVGRLLDEHPEIDGLVVGRHDLVQGAVRFIEETGRLNTPSFTLVAITDEEYVGDVPTMALPVTALGRRAGRLLLEQFDPSAEAPVPDETVLKMYWLNNEPDRST